MYLQGRFSRLRSQFFTFRISQPANNIHFLFRPDEIKETSLDNRELLLDFETVALASCPRTTLVLTNTSAIRARFSLEMDHFKAAKPPTPPLGKQID